MIINVDFKSLEVVTAAWLSQDEVMMAEIRAGVDMHEANRLAFNLPNRGVAKTLKFRILYGGTAYSFSKDPDFTPVSTNVKFWENVIEKYYTKYKGLQKWHEKLIREATTVGVIKTPFGREFRFLPVKKFNGDIGWPVTDIKNYPVQGTGADIVCMSRVMIYPKFKNLRSKLISTVHDSIVADCPEDEMEVVCKIFSEEISKTPQYISNYYGVDFNLPLVGEVSVGPNMFELTELK
jgi:DNA polymerase I-like protein with 3'-5' exonuclease and polymerase domains